jgi:hypothetical protein
MSQRTTITVEVAPGELIDKITILEIKSDRMSDPQQLRHVRSELDALTEARERAISPSPMLAELTGALKQVNETLWQIEDEIRNCERQKDFGPKFVELARSVYKNNDRRSVIKRSINELLGSPILEEKSHTPY